MFPYIGNFIIPIDFHIFQRGGPTTNQIYIYIHILVCNYIDAFINDMCLYIYIYTCMSRYVMCIYTVYIYIHIYIYIYIYVDIL